MLDILRGHSDLGDSLCIDQLASRFLTACIEGSFSSPSKAFQGLITIFPVDTENDSDDGEQFVLESALSYITPVADYASEACSDPYEFLPAKSEVSHDLFEFTIDSPRKLDCDKMADKLKMQEIILQIQCQLELLIIMYILRYATEDTMKTLCLNCVRNFKVQTSGFWTWNASDLCKSST